MWKKIRRFLTWLLYNAFWYLMGALGTIIGMSWAFNIFTFLTWITFIVAWLLIWYKHHCIATGEDFDSINLPVPIWLDATLDVLMALVIASTGHWFYAMLMIVNEVLFLGVLDGVKKKTEIPIPTVSS